VVVDCIIVFYLGCVVVDVLVVEVNYSWVVELIIVGCLGDFGILFMIVVELV